MLDQVAQALEEQDYQTANTLLQQLEDDEAENPWFQLYVARLDEATGNLESATGRYREILRNAANRKVVAQARQGIERINVIEENRLEFEKKRRQEALQKAKAQPGADELGLLILDSIPSELKQTAAQKLASIMNIDPYTARLQLPSRAWRLYRTGALGEMTFYQDTLREVGVPCFYASVTDIKQIRVYQVKYLESINPQATIVYEAKKGKLDSFSFDWADVSRRIEGLIPIFEECVEMDVKRKLQRKTKVLDYVKVCDLHLATEQCIIRLCDQIYEFKEGIDFSHGQTVKEGTTTARDNWNQLINYFQQKLPDVPLLSDFTPFGENAIDFQEVLKLIAPHLDLLRREETPWDAAFHLYSCLAFVRR